MRLRVLELGRFPSVGHPIPGFLVELDDGRRLLVDSGFRAPRPGTERDAVAVLVLTHLDLDHSGGLDLFPNAEVAVQRAALETADRDTDQRSWPVRAASGGVRWRLLDGDGTVAPGVDVVATPGHVPGHQSVLVHLRGGAVLLTGDAVFEEADWRPDRPPHPFDADGPAAVASTRRLLALAAEHGVREVVFGHDPQRWAPGTVHT